MLIAHPILRNLDTKFHRIICGPRYLNLSFPLKFNRSLHLNLNLRFAILKFIARGVQIPRLASLELIFEIPSLAVHAFARRTYILIRIN